MSVSGSGELNAESGAYGSTIGASRANNVASKREIYRRLNESFRKRYLHRFGRGVGFCAEFIHVLKAVAKCLDLRIQFCLQSGVSPEGFAVQWGWTDYFEPLFPEIMVPRVAAVLNRVHLPLGRVPLLKSLSRTCLKAACDCSYFVFDEFGAHPPARLSVPALGLGDDYWGNMQALAHLLWTYNPETIQAVAAYRPARRPRSAYNAVHVRRGDKEDEGGIHDLELYANAIRRLNTKTHQIIVVTDDIRVIDPLRNILGSDYVIQSYSDSSVGTGYDQMRFNSAPITTRRERTLHFLGELEVMFLADQFIGASTTNVFNLVRYMRANRDVIDVLRS